MQDFIRSPNMRVSVGSQQLKTQHGETSLPKAMQFIQSSIHTPEEIEFHVLVSVASAHYWQVLRSAANCSTFPFTSKLSVCLLSELQQQTFDAGM
jgi:hypothetical protein